MGARLANAVSLWNLISALTLRGIVFVSTVLGAAFLIQVLLWAAPGDPIDLIPNSAEIRPQLEAEWGLDKPLPERFFHTIQQGWNGTSLSVRPGERVENIIKPALWRSGKLLLAAWLLLVSMALWMARTRRPAVSRLARLLSVTPVFLLAYLLVMGINDGTYALVQDRLIERPDWFALPLQESIFKTILAIFILSIASGSLSNLQTGIENEILRIRQSSFVEAARARGMPTTPHIIKNLIPPLTILSTNCLTFAIGGLIILEKVLLLNGAGSLMWDACLKRDYPVAMGLAMAAALVICLARFAGDVIRIGVDPRLRSPK